MGVRPLAAIIVVVAISAAAAAEMPRHRTGRPAGAAAIGRDGGPRALRVVTKRGHPTHPTWYHDAQILPLGDRVTVAWNGRREVQAAQLRAKDLKIIDKATISAAQLGGATDSTGTDTDRHDVPAVVANAAGHLGFVYGGGSLAGHGPRRDGPLWRWATTPNALGPLTRERPLHIGGGAAFDFESVTDRTSTVHLIGQHGRGNTGSLIELRLGPNGTWQTPRELIRGGLQPGGCVLSGRPRGCNRFAIARMVADPASGRLHLVWGWSEASLSGHCRTDAGFCDHDLNYAFSDDLGATWHDATERRTISIAQQPLPAEAPAFRLLHGHVGLFKAVVVGPAGPLVVFSTFAEGRPALIAARLSGGQWTTTTLTPEMTGPEWKGSLVLRGGASYTLWTATGSAIHRFTSPDGANWGHNIVYRGPAWSLTGAPAVNADEELLLWRGRRDDDRSWVMLGAFPPGP